MKFASIASSNGSSQTSPIRSSSLTASPILRFLSDPPPLLRLVQYTQYACRFQLLEVLGLELIGIVFFVCVCVGF